MALIVNWFFYVFGVFLTLLPKLYRFHKEIGGTTWRTAFKFFVQDGESTSTTASVFAAYFVIGAWYLGLIHFGAEPQGFIPVHWTVSFFMGTISELVAPPLVKKFVHFISEKMLP
jgi:hypothetical protein